MDTRQLLLVRNAGIGSGTGCHDGQLLCRNEVNMKLFQKFLAELFEHFFSGSYDSNMAIEVQHRISVP